MCSAALSARASLREILSRRIVPLCCTDYRGAHYRTRSIVAKVRPMRIKNVSEAPVSNRRDRRLKVGERAQRDHEVEEPDDYLLSINSKSELGQYHAQVKEQFDERAKRLKNAILRKELTPPPLESNLLHWAARQQIRYLHEKNPQDWPPERIAEEFPISVNGAKRLLRSKRRIKPESIEAHDREVDAKWKLLKKIRFSKRVPEEGPVTLHAKTIELYLTGQLQSENLKAGNPSFPPAPADKDIAFPFAVGKEGSFFKIFQEYKTLSKGNQSNDQDEISTVESAGQEEKPAFQDEIGDDPEAATHLDLPYRLRARLERSFRNESMNLEDFKSKLNLKEQVRLGATGQPEEVPTRKKDFRFSSKPHVRIEKFVEPPKRKKQPLETAESPPESDAPRSSDGETLFRIPKY
ncbi:uncharacterized protein LOC100906408 [Galendromus occidentalis]|uniref:Uncharacterized protein LOC100906408 n=1 Tax=Galendromus occidentalis TaxID=34638 RepID=A0AAJ7SFE3_9ACAR|nr:uncharacterized protein LOC100906408 [Galendromus occidentalis]